MKGHNFGISTVRELIATNDPHLLHPPSYKTPGAPISSHRQTKKNKMIKKILKTQHLSKFSEYEGLTTTWPRMAVDWF